MTPSPLSPLLDLLGRRPPEHPGGEPEYTILFPATMLWSNFQRPHNILTQLARHHDVRALFNDWTIGEERYEGGHLIVTKRAFRRDYHLGPLVYYFSIPEKLGFLRTRRLRPDLVVFELMDVPEQEFEGWKAKLPEALTRADVVRTTSPAITAYLREHYAAVLAGKRVSTSRNGVDLQLFDPDREWPRPAELADIHKPILGFYGNLDWWIDWELIARLEAMEDVQVVIVGSTEGRAPEVPPALLDSSIRWIGWQPVQELPAYLAAFDVALFPFVVNEMTDGVDALKLWEYLAFGKPVLATPTAFIRSRGELFHLVSEDVEASVRAALQGRSDQARIAAGRAAAAERDWKVIADEMHDEICEALRP